MDAASQSSSKLDACLNLRQLILAHIDKPETSIEACALWVFLRLEPRAW
jgi:hypothetical protein